MSVLVKSMEMPQNCFDCLMSSFGLCNLIEGEPIGNPQKRLDNCPLVSVPPHGRLIDADALMLHILDYIEEYDDDLSDNGYHNGKWCAMKEAEMTINDAPTIIEAEVDE